jgi:hypothetical protein
VTATPKWVRRAQQDVVHLPQSSTPDVAVRVAAAWRRLSVWHMILTWATDDIDEIRQAFRDHTDACQRANDWAARAEQEPKRLPQRRR